MLSSPQANGENGWLAGLIWASCRWNNRLARAVIALSTPSVSQMAYPNENVMSPGCNMLQLPEPKWKTFTFMSTTALLHTPSVLVNTEIIIVFQHSPPFVHRCSSSCAGSDAGWLWLAVPPTSRNARPLPLSSRKLVRPEPKWSGRVGLDSSFSVARAKMAFDGGLISAQFPNLFQRLHPAYPAQASTIQTPSPYVSLSPSYLHPFNMQFIPL